jgi:hypothetical protein
MNRSIAQSSIIQTRGGKSLGADARDTSLFEVLTNVTNSAGRHRVTHALVLGIAVVVALVAII